MNIINKIFYLLTERQKKHLLVLAILLFIGVIFEMIGLGIFVPVLSLIVSPDKMTKNYFFIKLNLNSFTHFNLVLIILTTLIIFNIIKVIYLIFLSWKQSQFTTGLATDLGQRMFNGYLRLDYSFHLSHNSAELIRNVQGEIHQFISMTQAYVNAALEILIIIGLCSLLLLFEPMGAILVTTFLAVFSLIFHYLTKNKLKEWGNQRQHYAGITNQHLMQGLGGIKELKVLGKESFFLNSYKNYNILYSKIFVKFATLTLTAKVFLEFIAVLGLTLLIFIMFILGKSPELIISTLGLFAAAAFRIIPSVNRIIISLQTIKYNQVVIDVLYKEFKNFENIKYSNKINETISLKNSIKINNLSYTYPNTEKKSLSNLNLLIKSGDIIGIIGESGSGKSTFVDCILGLLEPSIGEIIVDEVNIKKNLRGWQNNIAYVPQTIYLSDDSLMKNIAFGNHEDQIDLNKLNTAIKKAELEDFVKNLTDGLETFVGERGVRLSGGQRQRIGLARAFYLSAPVLILDEATSALDTDTESKIMNQIIENKGSQTIIIIAHRLSTLHKCNKIIRMRNGEITEIITPDQLYLNDNSSK